MRILLYCLAAWVIASVPIGLFLGQLCRFSDSSPEWSGTATANGQGHVGLLRPSAMRRLAASPPMRKEALAAAPPAMPRGGDLECVSGLA